LEAKLLFRHLKEIFNRLIKNEKSETQYNEIDEIKEMMNKGELEKALKNINLIIEEATNPDIRLDAAVVKSDILNLMGEFQESLQIAERTLSKSIALSKNKQAVDAIIAITDQLFRLGNNDKGLELIRQGEEKIEQLKEELSPKEILLREFYLKNREAAFYSAKGERFLAYELDKKNLKRAEKLEDKERLARCYNNFGLSAFYIGELDDAERALLEAVKYYDEMNEQASIGYALNNISMVYIFKGELNIAETYLNKSIKFARKIGNEMAIGFALISLGHINKIRGNYEESFENYLESYQLRERIGNDKNTSESLFYLVDLALKTNKPQEAQKYYEEIKAMNDKTDNRIIAQRERVAKALLLQNESRARDKINAQTILMDVVEEEVADHELTVFAMLRLFELLLYELRTSENEEVLKELNELSEKIIKMAEKCGSSPMLAEITMLQAKLSLIELKTDEAQRKIRQALEIAKEKDLKSLIEIISQEKEQLEKQISTWDELANRESSFKERMDLAKMDSKLTENPAGKASIKVEKQIVPEKGALSLDQVNLIAYKFTKKGVTPFSIIGDEILDDTDLVRYGTFLSVAIALGSEYNTGLYGPLPVTGHPNLESIVYAELVEDPQSPDPRLGNKNYLILAIIYPKAYSDVFALYRNEVESLFQSSIKNDQIIDTIDMDLLKTIRRNITTATSGV
jgi:tetratricopeptide (TPR) repeat protein